MRDWLHWALLPISLLPISLSVTERLSMLSSLVELIEFLCSDFFYIGSHPLARASDTQRQLVCLRLDREFAVIC